MSSDNFQKALRPRDLLLLAGVLERFDLQSTTPAEAARFLIHEFQEGTICQADLAQALEDHLATQHRWRGNALDSGQAAGETRQADPVPPS